MTAPRLDLYDLAYLAGGPERVVDTAVVALVRSHRLRIRFPGQLATADLSRRHPVEAAVLDAVGPRGHRSVDTICWRLAEDERLLDVGRRLRSDGLLGRLGAVVTGLRGHPRALAPTRAGQRALRELGEGSAIGDPEAVRVALGGRAAMADAQLRAGIFEPPVTTLAPPGARRSRHDVDHSDPRLRAYRTGAQGVAGTGTAFMFGDGHG